MPFSFDIHYFFSAEEESSLSEDVVVLNRVARSPKKGIKKDKKKKNKDRKKRNKAKKNKSRKRKNRNQKRKSRKQKKRPRKNRKNGKKKANRKNCSRQSGPDDSTCMANIGTAMDYEGNQVRNMSK